MSPVLIIRPSTGVPAQPPGRGRTASRNAPYNRECGLSRPTFVRNTGRGRRGNKEGYGYWAGDRRREAPHSGCIEPASTTRSGGMGIDAFSHGGIKSSRPARPGGQPLLSQYLVEQPFPALGIPAGCWSRRPPTAVTTGNRCQPRLPYCCTARDENNDEFFTQSGFYLMPSAPTGRKTAEAMFCATRESDSAILVGNDLGQKIEQPVTRQNSRSKEIAIRQIRSSTAAPAPHWRNVPWRLPHCNLQIAGAIKVSR